jgi:hypothetical protein
MIDLSCMYGLITIDCRFHAVGPESLHSGKEETTMRKACGNGLVLALVFGVVLGAPLALSAVNFPVITAALPLFVEEAAAQDPINITGEECGIVLGPVGTSVCTTVESERDADGDATSTGSHGDPGRNGGFASVQDAGNVREDASCSVLLGDITTGEEGNQTMTVDEVSAMVPVVIAPSLNDAGVYVFMPDCTSAAETVGGPGITIDASGNDGEEGRDAIGVDGDDNN